MLKRTIAAGVMLGCAAAAGADVTETRMLEETVAVDGPSPRVRVKNVWGSVRVVAHEQNVVRMTAQETVHGDTPADVERARRELGLRTERDGGEVAFVVRDLDGNCECRRGWGWDDYRVEYDIELRVPSQAALDLSTVNDGEIVVEGVQGEFEARNVNGGVRLERVRGPGRASTVNGPLTASFERAPEDSLAFKTVNGRIDVQFPADLAADLRFKTMNGEIWTDFDAQPIVTAPASASRRGNRYVLRADARTAVRVGAGGPAHSFETLNGDIFVREATR